jgi:hypothetical protein
MARSRVIGDRELMRNLRRLPGAASGQSLDKSMKISLEPMRAATSQNARRLRQPGKEPKGGHLDQGVVTAKVDGRGQFFRVWWVSFARRARHIAHLVEFGTRPHLQPLRGIMHPGARPKPFFRPAFEETKRIVVDDFGVQVWGLLKSFTLRAVQTRRR